MKSYAFLFWGYLVVWAGLTLYFITLLRKIADVARRLDALEGRAKRGGAPQAT
jgi:CcmD family protein